ncbi:hypothetical protein LUZ61_010872 [Rhynchospora tenuis]|uniref:Uncharacterized protein n=1 Tax=Rhynchospora tenuis TaxID=198213 RepID=A0AAD6A016_9POAL|nr:hypothetical protein LUZ61_010872 [Rhynchospora tenuis]
MSWRVDGSKCIDTITTSYEYLPLAEKLCFLYFAAFPEDHEIKAEVLLRIWVAERLIPHEDTRTLEETAERFLEDLVQRSMVQVERLPDGSIDICRVHDTLRDLAIQKAKDMNFLMVCSSTDDWESCSKARRVAIHCSSHDNGPKRNCASPNVRSLLFFADSSKLDCSQYRVLRVLLNMRGKLTLQSFRGSSHLRYLGLDGSDIRGKETEFGIWITGMKYLETLDLTTSMHGDLSKWIWKVKTLRHVMLGTGLETQGPPTTVDLRNVQTLRCVSWNRSWETSDFPNIPKARELVIRIDNLTPEREVANLLCRLKYLLVLELIGPINLSKIANGVCVFNDYLKFLIIQSKHRLPLVLCDDMLPRHLMQLNLEGYKFESDPMPVLEKLESLKALSLCGCGFLENSENAVRGIRCSSGGFKQLEVLEFERLPWEVWEFEMGAMPMLRRLKVRRCYRLRMPPVLNYLPRLQDVDWEYNLMGSMLLQHWS